MMKRYLIYISILTMALTGITSCSDVEFFDSDDEIVSMTYTIGLGDDVQGRAIGDGNNVDRLYVEVYEEGEEVKRIEGNISNREAQITIELFKNRTYDLVFWAQSSQTDVYDLTDLRNISFTYPDTMTLQEAARMDAFFLLKEDVTVTEMGMNGGELTLKRPFAQLNIAASEEDAPERIKRAVLTLQYKNEDSLVLTYTDFTVEEGDKVTNNEVDYYYVATAFLKPGIISGKVVLYDDSNKEIKSFYLNQGENLELRANHRYNVLGDMITQEELPGWDGITITAPEQEENRYIIDDEADLAWLSQKASTLLEGATFVITKKTLNMGNKEIASIQLPAGSTFDGNGNTIRNYANSLFGDATNITVQNLNLDGITASSDSHVGVLVNTLTGNGTFSEITIQNSKSETMNGAAGGMIGYIVRASEKERSEQLEVMIENCSISKTVITDSSDERYEGLFVGLLSGYDNGEKLTFMNCTATEDIEVPDIYNDFLGNETYCRGLVMLNEERFMPKWDGTSIEPLLANPIYDGENAIAGANKFVVYSPFDLAGVRKKTASPAAIYLKADIDMNGQGADGEYAVPSLFTSSQNESDDDYNFDPFSSIAYLDGDEHTIYNLGINMKHDGYNGAAFIGIANGTTVHKNIIFDGANIRNVHDSQYEDGHALAGNAYAGTLVGTVDSGNYTAENIKVKNGSVFGVCKMGGIIGRTMYASNIQLTRCCVDNYYLENYDPGVKDDGGFVVYGEVGGLIGFIRNSGTINECSVTNTRLNCIHYSGLGAILPGRHVNQFIGDIRTPYKEIISITNYKVENNKYLKDKDEHQEYTYGTYSLFGISLPKSRKNKTPCEIIGMAYYVWTSETIGTVEVDGIKVFYGEK